LFLPHWATFSQAGTYGITCRRLLQVARPTTGREFLKQPTTDVVVEARTELLVLPRNDARLGQLIREHGETMLRAAGARGGDEAVIALAWIDDARVVPCFRGALKIPSYALKFVAVQVMGRFATDEACEGLQAAMAVSAADFAYAADENSRELAARIRHAAAGALGRSRHPAAAEFLVAHRRDESEPVRLTVLNAIARLPAPRAVPLLEELARDRSPLVAEAARRHLAALHPEAGKTKLK
ncbi:MAG: HEAT repeat domain-containing protein, partial [Verrucomicrobia bacterium]|nr:HEAT repeat domain-containing protein [Verrucomicrobiota bacterium]